MQICWKIRGFNREAKDFFDLYLYTDTDTLKPVDRHRVEHCVDENSPNHRNLLKHRALFRDDPPIRDSFKLGRVHKCVGIDDYLEDEHGKEISVTEAARIQTGNENIVAFPPGYRPHDIRLALSPNSIIPDNPLDHLKLNQEDVDTLALFVRDAKELTCSPFYKTCPILHSGQRGEWIESISVEFIRSFVTVFRRLYMEKEQGNYLKACKVYSKHFLNKRLTDWIDVEKELYETYLSAAASFGGLSPTYSFTNKRLIDAFIYTKFAHQPSVERDKQFKDCLREVGNQAKLEWIFYMTLRHVATSFRNALNFIDNELNAYLKLGGMRPSLDCVPFTDESGRGWQLTEEERQTRAVKERADKLGDELWREAGSPRDELHSYIVLAEEILAEEGVSNVPKP
jgi:hypothetical protein